MESVKEQTEIISTFFTSHTETVLFC